MPVVNIPIKILGQGVHSRSNSSSSVDNDRPYQTTQQPQQPQQSQQQSQQPTVNTNMDHGFSSSFPSRSPIPDFPGFQNSGFPNDNDWPGFSSFRDFPSGFGRSNFSDFPTFGRSGGLSPNPQMGSFRGSRAPTPTTNASPTSTLRRNSQPSQQQQQQYQQHPQQQQQPQPQYQPNYQHQQQQPQQHHHRQENVNHYPTANSKPNSRPPSRAREPKDVEVPERPAVIPLPPPANKTPEKELKKKSSQDSGKGDDVLEENIAKIRLGNDNCELCPQETDGDPSPLTSPITEGKPKRGKKLQRNQSVVDFNAKTIVTLDKIEIQVEQLRKKAAELELEKDQILRSLGEISVHNCMFKLAECDREEIEAITERLTKRTKTVQVVVETPRNEEQKKALEDATKMIDDVNNMMKTDVDKAKICLQTYMNACSYEETAGATCQNFLKVIIQCAADDQKRIKRRLENLMSQIENAQQATYDLMDDESE